MKEDGAGAICLQLREAGILVADDERIELLSRSIALTVTYWLNFDNLLGQRAAGDEHLIHDGVLQVLSLIAPYLGTMQQEFMSGALAIYASATKDPTGAAK